MVSLKASRFKEFFWISEVSVWCLRKAVTLSGFRNPEVRLLQRLSVKSKKKIYNGSIWHFHLKLTLAIDVAANSNLP